MNTDRDSIGIFYFLLSNRRDKFIAVWQNIYECHCRVCQQMLFKDMFYGHEFRRYFPDSRFRIGYFHL